MIHPVKGFFNLQLYFPCKGHEISTDKEERSFCNEYNNIEATSASATDIYHNYIDITSLNNVLCCLTLFLLSNSVIVVMAE